VTITYPLSLPETLGVARFAWTNFNSVGMMRSPFTYKPQVQQHQGQLWAAEVTIATTSKDEDIAPWYAFVAALEGPNGTFYMGDPRRTTLLGNGPSGGPVRVMGGGQTGRTIATDGWPGSASNVVKKGDYIQIDNHLHMVLSDHNTNSSGETTIDIWPRLRESPADNTVIVLENTVGVFQLADSEVKLVETESQEWSYVVAFSAVEAL
jgi:hypothetical protein